MDFKPKLVKGHREGSVEKHMKMAFLFLTSLCPLNELNKAYVNSQTEAASLGAYMDLNQVLWVYIIAFGSVLLWGTRTCELVGFFSSMRLPCPTLF